MLIDGNDVTANLQITGSPEIPDSVLITATPDLSPWRSDYYGDSIDAETALTSARVRRAEAEADQRIAVAALRKALGLSQLDTPPAPSPK